jgi:hypothetical protein
LIRPFGINQIGKSHSINPKLDFENPLIDFPGRKIDDSIFEKQGYLTEGSGREFPIKLAILNSINRARGCALAQLRASCSKNRIKIKQEKGSGRLAAWDSKS